MVQLSSEKLTSTSRKSSTLKSELNSLIPSAAAALLSV